MSIVLANYSSLSEACFKPYNIKTYTISEKYNFGLNVYFMTTSKSVLLVNSVLELRVVVSFVNLITMKHSGTSTKLRECFIFDV